MVTTEQIWDPCKHRALWDCISCTSMKAALVMPNHFYFLKRNYPHAFISTPLMKSCFMCWASGCFGK